MKSQLCVLSMVCLICTAVLAMASEKPFIAHLDFEAETDGNFIIKAVKASIINHPNCEFVIHLGGSNFFKYDPPRADGNSRSQWHEFASRDNAESNEFVLVEVRVVGSKWFVSDTEISEIPKPEKKDLCFILRIDDKSKPFKNGLFNAMYKASEGRYVFASVLSGKREAGP